MKNNTITINGTPISFTTSGYSDWTDVIIENDSRVYRINLSEQKVVKLIESQLSVNQVKQTLDSIAE